MRSSSQDGHGALRSLALAAVLLASGCGPGVATPMPEPPTVFNLDAISKPEVAIVSDSVSFTGRPGAVPAFALVRVTNLDGTGLAMADTAAANGSFTVSLGVSSGDELRFEWLLGDRRSDPADAIWETQVALTPSPRLACLELTPRYLAEFGADGESSIAIVNRCSEAVVLDNARLRRGLGDFQVAAPLPLDLATGEATTLVVTFARAADGEREDTLLFDATRGGDSYRYPITLFAPLPP